MIAVGLLSPVGARGGRPEATLDEQRIIELETRIAYQEQSLQELNDALASQQVQLSQLMHLAESIRERMEALATASAGEDTPAGERPPHY